MQSRDNRGRYSRKQRLAMWSVVFVAIAVFGLHPFTMGLLTAMIESTQNTAYAENTVDPAVLARAMMGKSIDALKDEVVADIEKCESNGDYGIIIFDSNNEASVGGMQFQRKTVQHYEKKFYAKDVSKTDAIAIAISKEDARGLAKAIIFGEKDGWVNWYNCGRKVNAEARVAAIKSLTN